MSRFKFRAWDKENEQLVYHIEQTYDGLGWYEENDNNKEGYMHMSCFDSWFDDQFIIMQFTGLIDKHEVKIYEGDIVKYVYDELPMGHYREIELTGIIKWRALGYGIEIISSDIPATNFDDLDFEVEDYHFEKNACYPLHEMEIISDDLEVVGNIFQNRRENENETK